MGEDVRSNITKGTSLDISQAFPTSLTKQQVSTLSSSDNDSSSSSDSDSDDSDSSTGYSSEDESEEDQKRYGLVLISKVIKHRL